MRPLAYERSKLFDQEAERYDRSRPTYPDAVIDELLGPEPGGLDVLDVGCGTGIASRAMAGRGAKVVGVEVAPRMAEIARRHGIHVEVDAFEDWDAAGRTFDLITSAQAWHWLDCLSPPRRPLRCCDRAAGCACSGTPGASPMIWPTPWRSCMRGWCRAAGTVYSGGMRPTGHLT